MLSFAHIDPWANESKATIRYLVREVAMASSCTYLVFSVVVACTVLHGFAAETPVEVVYRKRIGADELVVRRQPLPYTRPTTEQSTKAVKLPNEGEREYADRLYRVIFSLEKAKDQRQDAWVFEQADLPKSRLHFKVFETTIEGDKLTVLYAESDVIYVQSLLLENKAATRPAFLGTPLCSVSPWPPNVITAGSIEGTKAGQDLLVHLYIGKHEVERFQWTAQEERGAWMRDQDFQKTDPYAGFRLERR